MIRTMILAATTAFVVSAAPAHAETKYNLTVAGASPEGLWSLLGTGLNAAMAAEFPGSTVTYQTSGGGLANINLISSSKVEMGIAHNVELRTAVAGEAPFRAPVTNLRALGYLYNWAPMQLVMNKSFAEKHNIKTIGDIKAKRVPVRFAVNQRGNMVQEMNKQILAAYGISYEDIEKWGGQVVFAASSDQADLMSDRRIDMLGNGVFAPHKSIMESSRAVEVVMIGLDADKIKTVAKATGADPYVIKAGAYAWQPNDVSTVALGAALVASDMMGEQTAYDVARAMHQAIDKMRGVHKSMQALTPQLLTSLSVVPYHPGALRYYREAGLVK